MNKGTHFRVWKRWVQGAVALLLLLNLGLVLSIWRAAESAPQAQRDERDRLAAQARLMAADVGRAQAIRQRLPQKGRECDQFYAEELVPASSGYSTLVSDLGEIAGHAGLKTNIVGFKQKELAERGVTEVKITAAVEGDYPSLIRFINGLERSKNFYLLDQLTLASSSTGGIKLNMELRTYFRS
jgi:hypothetical protein